MIISFITPISNKISFSFFKRQFLKKKEIIRYSNYEIIFIFDGKPSKQISSYIKKNERKKLKFFILNKNFGPGIARNLGIKKSKAKKIIFLDIDDNLNFFELNSLYKTCIRHKEKLISFNYTLINKKTKTNVFKKNESFLKSKDKIKYLLKKNLNREVLYYIFDKDFLIKNDLFFKKGVYEDLLFLFKFFTKYKKKGIVYKKIIGYKYDNKKSITNTINENSISNKIAAWIDIKDYLTKLGYPKIDIQYRLRSEFYDAIKASNKLKNEFKRKKIHKNLINILRKKITRNFTPKTIKDRYIKKILNEV